MEAKINSLVGYEKLQAYLDKQVGLFTQIKIANTHNDKTNWRKEFTARTAAENITLLMDYLNEWDTPNFTWWICLFKDKTQVERFPWSSKKTELSAVGAVQQTGLDPEFVRQLVEAEKRAAVAEYQMNQMAQEVLSGDEEEDEEDEGIIGQITREALPQIIPMIPALINGIINKLNDNRQPLQVSGVETDPEVMQLVQVLFDNGVTTEHLQKLAAMATNEKMKFKMILGML